MIRDESHSLPTLAGVVCFGVLAAVFCGNLFMGEESTYRRWTDARKQQAVMKAEVQRLEAVSADLSRQIRLLQTDPSYVEKVIRQRLNYVRDGELLYIFDKKEKRQEKWLGAHPGGKS